MCSRVRSIRGCTCTPRRRHCTGLRCDSYTSWDNQGPSAQRDRLQMPETQSGSWSHTLPHRLHCPMHVNMKRTTHMKGLNIHHALQKVQCDLSLLKPIICDELAYVSDWTTQDNINLTKVIFALSRQGNKKKKIITQQFPLASRLKALLMIFGLQCCKSKSIMYYNNRLGKLSILHELGMRVVLGMCRVMKMIHVYGVKCENGRQDNKRVKQRE